MVATWGCIGSHTLKNADPEFRVIEWLALVCVFARECAGVKLLNQFVKSVPTMCDFFDLVIRCEWS